MASPASGTPATSSTLTDGQLKAVGCAQKRDALGDPIEGKYVCPSYSTFHYVLAHKDKAGRHDFDVADYAARLSKWMTAQAGRLPRHLAVDGKFIREIAWHVTSLAPEDLLRREVGGETGTRARSPLSDSRGGRVSGNSVKASTEKGENQTVI